MKRIFSYIFAAFAAVAVASCGHSHEEHSHSAHSHETTHDGHSHDGHSHDGHSHDGHSHDGHSHDEHSHEVDAHKGTSPIIYGLPVFFHSTLIAPAHFFHHRSSSQSQTKIIATLPIYFVMQTFIALLSIIGNFVTMIAFVRKHPVC